MKAEELCLAPLDSMEVLVVPSEEDVHPPSLSITKYTSTNLFCKPTVRRSEGDGTRNEKCAKRFQISDEVHIIITHTLD